jgi:hypothetical protein
MKNHEEPAQPFYVHQRTYEGVDHISEQYGGLTKLETARIAFTSAWITALAIADKDINNFHYDDMVREANNRGQEQAALLFDTGPDRVRAALEELRRVAGDVNAKGPINTDLSVALMRAETALGET